MRKTKRCIYTNIHIQYVCIYPAVYINTTVVQKHVQEQGRQPPRRTHLHKRLNDRKSYMMPGIVDSSRSLGIFCCSYCCFLFRCCVSRSYAEISQQGPGVINLFVTYLWLMWLRMILQQVVVVQRTTHRRCSRISCLFYLVYGGTPVVAGARVWNAPLDAMKTTINISNTPEY